MSVVSFSCSHTPWSPIYIEEIISFESYCVLSWCDVQGCIPLEVAYLSHFLSFLSRGIIILKFLCSWVICCIIDCPCDWIFSFPIFYVFSNTRTIIFDWKFHRACYNPKNRTIIFEKITYSSLGLLFVIRVLS